MPDNLDKQGKHCGCDKQMGDYSCTLVRTTRDEAYLKHADGHFYLHERTVLTYWCRPNNPMFRAYAKRTFGPWSKPGRKADFKDIAWRPEGPGLDAQREGDQVARREDGQIESKPLMGSKVIPTAT